MAVTAATTIIGRNNSVGVVRLVIRPVSGATSYKVYRDTSAGATTLLAGGVPEGAYYDATVAPGTHYYYRVKATNGSGDSAYSNEVSLVASAATSDLTISPTGIADNLPIQAAIDALSTTGGRIVLAPGDYAFAGGLSFTHNARVEVVAHGAVFRLAAGVTGLTFNQGSTGGATRGAMVIGARIEGADDTGTIGAVFQDTNWSGLYQVQIDNCGRGLLMHNFAANEFVEGITLEDVIVRTPGVYGIEFRRTGGTNSFGQHMYRGLMISNVINGAVGFKLPSTTSIYRSRMHVQVWVGTNGTAFSIDGDTDGATLQFSVEGATGSTGNVAMVVGSNSTGLDKANIEWYVTGTINTEFSVSASKDLTYRQGRHFKGHTANSTSPIRVMSHADSAAKITLGINGTSGGRVTLGNGSGTNDVFWERGGAAYGIHSGGFKASTLSIQTKAGTPTDGDLTGTVQDGAIVIDTSANKIWVRVGGAWKSVAVA